MEQSASAAVPTYDPALAEALRTGDGDDEIAVIVRLSGDHEVPPCARVVTRFGDIATLRVRRDCVTQLVASEAVTAIESSLGLNPEPAFDDVAASDVALLERSVDGVATSAYSRRPEGVTATGRGVIVGVLDWGCDFAHPAFRNADGSTRFLAIWDQRGDAAGPDNRWGYGRIIRRAEIDDALRGGDPYGALDYEPARADTKDPESGRWMGAHGTHVCAIAAGSDYEGGMPGVAPGADLVFVDLARTEEVLGRGNLGDSVTVLEALDFIFTLAGERPCVVNMSIGAHGGPHDGTTLVELGIDRAVWLARGRAVINSAGNYYDARGHAEGRLAQGGEDRLRIRVPAADPTESEIELWYSGADRFTARVIDPTGTELAVVQPGSDRPLLRDGAVYGHIYHVLNTTNREHHIDIFLRPHVPPGTWELRLTGDVVQDGRYHAWIERERGPRPRFVAADATSSCTTGTVCNGRLSITVGAYDPHRAARRLGAFSSAGPTRDGRTKPELCAPGVRIRAARSSAPAAPPGAYHATKSGTSMAAPHVTGTVALMFEAAGAPLEISDTRALLFASADRFTLEGTGLTSLDVHRFGNGFLNIAAAEAAVREWAGTDTDESMSARDDEQEDTMTFEQDGADEVHEHTDRADCGCDHAEIVADAEAAAAAYDDWTRPEHDPAMDLDEWTQAEPFDVAADPEWYDAAPEAEPFAAPGDAEDIDDSFELPDQDEAVAEHAGSWTESLEIEPVAIVVREVLRGLTDGSRGVSGADALHEAAFESLGVRPDAPLTSVATAASPLVEPVRAGDVLVRSDPTVGVMHSAIVLSDTTEDAVSIAVRGVPVENAGPGAYVEVLESWGGGPPRAVGRRLTDSWGRVPRGQMLLRPERAIDLYSDTAKESAEGAFVEQAVDWCATRAAIVAAARAEERRWTRPDGTRFLENHPSRLPILTDYWSRVPGFSNPATAANAAQNSANDVAGFEWSAAFICFVMHTAGVRAAHGFEFGRRHMDYIVGALRNRERSDRGRPFWLVDHIEVHGEAAPKPGDVLCFNRRAQGVMTRHTYQSLRAAFWSNNNQNRPARGSSHCSIVVGTVTDGPRRFIETIGGNEDQSVRVRRVAANSAGGVADAECRNIFGMIRLTEC